MNETQRFDEKTQAKVNEAAAKLLRECPELGSVAIVCGWDMPIEALPTLPAGEWAFRDSVVGPDRVCVIQLQLARLISDAATIGLTAATELIAQAQAGKGKHDGAT